MTPRPHNCCGDYTRSQLLRSAAAEAGKGLPVIEPGMPEPAGTGLSRRTFLSRSAGLALAVYGASKLPFSVFEEGIAQAAGGDRVLLSVFFDGGVDSLSLLAPVGDPRYAQLRPNLALTPETGTAFSEDPRLRWHPAAAGLATLHAEGKVSAFPAIGYDHPDQSHFTSRHFYEVGELAVGFRTGWLGRYIDSVGDAENPLQGLSMDGSLSPMLATAEKPVAAIDSVDGFDLWSAVGNPVRKRCTAASPASARCPRTPPASPRSATPRPRPTSCARTSRGSASSPARSLIPTPGSPTSSPGWRPTSPPGCRSGR